MAIDKKTFLRGVTVICDTREQKNEHITKALAEMGIMTETRKLDYGDYSFSCEGRDFSMSCVVERKANVDEIYNNVINERGRIEKEMYAASQCAKQMTLIIEGIGSWEQLKNYRVPTWQMKACPQRKKEDIGALVYATLKSWQVGNRYRFNVEFVDDNSKTASKMLEIFYYYWRSYKEMTGGRSSG